MLQADAQHTPTHSPKEQASLTIADLNTTINHEPRLHDIRVAKRLGFERSRAIRQIIERNHAELETYGSLATRCGKSRGQEFTEYWLNEPQTLLICMFSKTPNAAAVRREVIDVYLTYRRGHAGAGNANPASLPLNDGRYVVVMQGQAVASVHNISGRCVIDGNDPVNVFTFLRECAANEVMPAVLDAAIHRLCFLARSGNRNARDELLLAMAQASAALTKGMDTSQDRLIPITTDKQNQGRLF